MRRQLAYKEPKKQQWVIFVATWSINATKNVGNKFHQKFQVGLWFHHLVTWVWTLGGEQKIINKLGSKQGLRCKQKGALQLACNNFKWIFNKQKVGVGKGGFG